MFTRALTVIVAPIAGLAGATSAHAATFTVSNTADTGAGSLRAAIASANADSGPSTIAFSIGTGPQTISPASALPALTEPTTIDATTQPGYAGAPLITLSGASAGAASGLLFLSAASPSSVNALKVSGWAADGIAVAADGTSIDLSTLENNLGNGIAVSSADDVAIGTGGSNVITGNGNNGISVSSSSGLRVAGNSIGLAADGVTPAGNVNGGVSMGNVTSALIGGTAAADRNTIVGNLFGVSIVGTGASGNKVEGNSVGVPASTTNRIPNVTGILLSTGAHDNTIGGDGVRRNVISGNSLGVLLQGSGTTGNEVSGNYIGFHSGGSADVGNGTGVLVFGAKDNTIGGTTAAKRNLIGWNGTGVRLTGAGTTGNVVSGNYVGLDAPGLNRAPNRPGIQIDDHASGNKIGGGAAGAGNLISGNLQAGVRITSQGVGDTVVSGNVIGLAADGRVRGNGTGVAVGNGSESSDRTLIGGRTAAERNVISGNDAYGVLLTGPADDTRIEGNFIGTDPTGQVNRGNGAQGVYVSGAQTTDTMVGGTASGAGNVISGNVHGVEAATGRVDILGNLIGTDASGTAPLPPVQRRGVVFGLASDIRVGGTAPGAGNVIAFNESGVEGFVSGVRVPIRGNRIFSNTNWLGIDLKGNDGVTANDPGDADGGPNGLQNFPVVDAAITADGKTEVNGVLDTAPSAAFTIDLYASDACDPSGYGEGERYLGAAAATTDGSGHASFSYTTTGAVPAGDVITATATTADGSTSEFSACRAVTTPPAPPAETPTSAPPAAEPPAQPQPQSSQPAAPRPPTRLPAASLTAPRRLRVGQVRAIAVTFAPDSDGDYTVGGVIAVPGLKGKARALKARNGSITAGQKAKIKLIPPRALIASARKALRKRKSLTAELSVRLVAADGQVRTLKRTIEIVR